MCVCEEEIPVFFYKEKNMKKNKRFRTSDILEKFESSLGQSFIPIKYVY